MTKAMMTFLLVSVLSSASLAAPASDHHPSSATATHDAAHDSSHATTMAPPEGKRWPTDEFLRTGMSRIETAVEQSAAGPSLSRDDSLALARTIEQNVTDIVEHCRLPPEADAALHVVIARMLAASHQLKENASSAAAVAQVRGALQDYRSAFDHSPAASTHRH